MNFNRKRVKTLIFAIIAVVIIAISVGFLNSGTKSKSQGTIHIELVDLSGTKIDQKQIEFYEGDTLVRIVEDNFRNVEISNGMLLTIENLITPKDWSSFICIYVNGDMSMVGISEIRLEDKMVVSFEMTEYETE